MTVSIKLIIKMEIAYATFYLYTWKTFRRNREIDQFFDSIVSKHLIPKIIQTSATGKPARWNNHYQMFGK